MLLSKPGLGTAVFCGKCRLLEKKITVCLTPLKWYQLSKGTFGFLCACFLCFCFFWGGGEGGGALTLGIFSWSVSIRSSCINYVVACSLAACLFMHLRQAYLFVSLCSILRWADCCCCCSTGHSRVEYIWVVSTTVQIHSCRQKKKKQKIREILLWCLVWDADDEGLKGSWDWDINHLMSRRCIINLPASM